MYNYIKTYYVPQEHAKMAVLETSRITDNALILMMYSMQQYCDMHMVFGAYNGKVLLVKNEYAHHFPTCHHP